MLGKTRNSQVAGPATEALVYYLYGGVLLLLDNLQALNALLQSQQQRLQLGLEPRHIPSIISLQVQGHALLHVVSAVMGE